MRTCTSRGARGTRACLAHVSVQKIGMGVICLTVLDILLPVHEPGGEELKSTLDDNDQLGRMDGSDGSDGWTDRTYGWMDG